MKGFREAPFYYGVGKSRADALPRNLARISWELVSRRRYSLVVLSVSASLLVGGLIMLLLSLSYGSAFRGSNLFAYLSFVVSLFSFLGAVTGLVLLEGEQKVLSYLKDVEVFDEEHIFGMFAQSESWKQDSRRASFIFVGMTAMFILAAAAVTVFVSSL